MNIGKACAIFRDIFHSYATDEEKLVAIGMVAGMETHNGIAKEHFVNAIRWLLTHREVWERHDET